MSIVLPICNEYQLELFVGVPIAGCDVPKLLLNRDHASVYRAAKDSSQDRYDFQLSLSRLIPQCLDRISLLTARDIDRPESRPISWLHALCP